MHERTLLAGIVGLALACTGMPDSVLAPTETTADITSIESSTGAGQWLSQGIAVALSDPKVRLLVKDAFRNSPYTEHKLVIQDWLRTAEAEPVVRLIAAGLNMTSLGLLARADSLPRLDFYVPRKADRRAWSGTPHVFVALDLDGDHRSLNGFSSARPGLVRNATFAEPLILLHPEEPKGHRIGRQQQRAGPTIQDSDDGEVAIVIVRSLPDGTTSSVDVGRENSPGSPPGPSWYIEVESDPGYSSSGGGASPPDTTLLGVLEVLDICDNWDCYQGNEFDFRTKYFSSNGTELAAQTLMVTGIPADSRTIVNQPLIFRELLAYTTNYMQIFVKEIDGWPNPDDSWDPDPVVIWNWNGDQFAWNGDQFGTGDLRCNYNNWWGAHPCDQVFWRQINWTVFWSY
ncbi:MAG: hypothetical protein NUW01_00925 [Gemmatimonadaceae bacterium]|nr:hypothetical protein [Gemmatimonadaceae bacterium]